MATQQSTVDFILQQIAAAGVVEAKKMFGEYGLYCDGKIFAFVCDDELFMKPTEAGSKFIGKVREGYPYPGSKPYFLISRDRWDEREWLVRLVQVSAADLPPPKPKAPARKKSL